MSHEYQELIMPSSPEDRKKLKAGINEVVNCLARVKGETEAKKEIVEALSEEFEISKKLILKAATTFFKENYQAQAAENEDFETFIETLVGDQSAAPAATTSVQ